MAGDQSGDEELLVVRCEPTPEYAFHCDALADSFPDARELSLVSGDKLPSLGDVDGVVISGSTAGVYEDDTHDWIEEGRELVRGVLDREIPTLGVCFGHQLVNDALGGTVERRDFRAGLVTADLADDPLFDGVSPVVPVMHGDFVVETGAGLDVIASARDYDYPYFGTRHRESPVWTVQFHPEIGPAQRERLTEAFEWSDGGYSFGDVNGERVFENFRGLVGEW